MTHRISLRWLFSTATLAALCAAAIAIQPARASCTNPIDPTPCVPPSGPSSGGGETGRKTHPTAIVLPTHTATPTPTSTPTTTPTVTATTESSSVMPVPVTGGSGGSGSSGNGEGIAPTLPIGDREACSDG